MTCSTPMAYLGHDSDGAWLLRWIWDLKQGTVQVRIKLLLHRPVPHKPILLEHLCHAHK